MTAYNTVNILVVEDDPVDVEAIRRAFAKHRIANPVHYARDGIDALRLLRGEDGVPRLPQPYLILLDLNMPRMNGFEFLDAIRSDEALSSSIVFVLTTSDLDRDRAEAYKKQIAGYVVKDHVGEDFIHLVNMLGGYWNIVEFPPQEHDGAQDSAIGGGKQDCWT